MKYYLCREYRNDELKYVEFNDRIKALDEAKKILKSGSNPDLVLLSIAKIETLRAEVVELKVTDKL